MYKYARFPLFLVILIVLAVNTGSAEDWFDEHWYQRRFEQDFESTSRGLYRFGEAYRTAVPDPDAEQGIPYVRLMPPAPVYEPITTVEDSINVDEGYVRRERRIPGFRVERYSFIPLDSYVELNRLRQFEKLWDTELTLSRDQWVSREEEGISDLNFVIPVGSRFESLVGGRTNINIDGSQYIEFSGRSEYDEGVVGTSTTRNSSFPTLSMEQRPKFTIRGNVGDRLTVDIRQDSQLGMFANLQDNISIKYQGEENSIIQNIEAGNTSLRLPGASFAGYSGEHRGLFGIRTESQIGPLKLTAIASQEKGEAGSKTFRGQVEESTNQIRDYQYKGNTYFFLDFAYRYRFAETRDDLSRIAYVPADSVAVFEVYVNDGDERNDTDEATLAYPGTAWPMDIPYVEEDGTVHQFQEFPDRAVDGFYHRLDPSKYYVDRQLGFIQFESSIPDTWTVGVYMVTRGGEQYGSLGYDANNPETTRNTFKLIKRNGQRPTDTETWNLEWKNVYDLGQRDIDLSALDISIYREATDGVSRDKQNGVSYIHILGLDNVDEFGNPGPDQKVDFSRGFVNQYRGELIFPLLEPFNSDTPPAGVTEELAEKVPEVYTSANTKNKQEATRYYIEVRTAERQGRIQIGGGFGGILEDSETITLNGKELVKGTDYQISYATGVITFTNEEALSPNADIQVNYQEANAFQQMQKTLFGLHADYDLFSGSRLGATFLFNNETTKDYRVRLGNEPSRTMLFDVDTDLRFEPQFLTTAVDALPGVVASTPSTVNVVGEYARVMPNMNTRGDVSLDDFEGTQNTSLTISRGGWYPASRPESATTHGSILNGRGRLQWYNPRDQIPTTDIWPKRETSYEENTVNVLTLAYGMSEDAVHPNESWAGVQNAFWGSGVDLSRARFLEIWARGGEGTLNVDLGSISEDFYPFLAGNGKLDTEDRPIPGQGHGDGVLTLEEDTGLDGLFNANEPGYSPSNKDPNGDDWHYDYSEEDYTGINGMEGNARDSDRAGIPDTEDINHNGILDTRNAYYEYSVNFDPFVENPYLVKDSIAEGPNGQQDPAGWRLFRIPLWNNDEAAMNGTASRPDSTLIENLRMWVTGADSAFIQIASMEIVESNWQEAGIVDENGEDVMGLHPDEMLRISTKNTNENNDYTPPPGVKGELNREYGIREKEQSIVLETVNLRPGHTAFISRNFEKMDLTDYTKLKLNVHGPDEFPPETSETSDYEFIVRFGGDKDNYYEYRTPVFRGWSSRSFVEVDLTTIAELKLMQAYGFDASAYAASILDSLIVARGDSATGAAAADSIASAMHAALMDSVFRVVGDDVYTLRGSPSLNNVRTITFGLKNNNPAEELTSEIWLDELRLDNLREMGGTAYKTSVKIDLSGFMQLSGGVQRVEDDFHGMNAEKGSGKDENAFNGSATINLDRFMPKRWGFSLPVSYNYSQSEALPRLKSGSDITLPGERLPGELNDKWDFRDSAWERKGRISYKKSNDPTKTGLAGFATRWALEKASFDYDWGESYSRTATRGIVTNNNQRLNAMYDFAPKEKGFLLLGWMPLLPTTLGRAISNATFNYTPSGLSYNVVWRTNNTYTTDIDGNIDAPKKTDMVDQRFNLAYNPFRSIRYSYVQNRSNDLTLMKSDKVVSFSENSKLAVTAPDMLYFRTRYDYSVLYDEDNDPKLSLSGQLGSRTVAFTRGLNVTADFEIDRLLEERLSGRPRPPRREESTEADRPTWGDWFGGGGDNDGGSAPAQSVEEAGDGADQGVPSPAPAPAAGGDAEPAGESMREQVVMALAEAINPLTLEYRQSESYNYSGLTGDRPGLDYRLGFRIISPPDTSTVVVSRNTSSQNRTFTGRTEFQLPYDLGATARVTMDTKEQINSSARQRTETMTYPDLAFTLPRFEQKVTQLQRWVTNMNFTWDVRYGTITQYQTDFTRPVSESKKWEFAPLVSVNAKLLRKYDISFSLSTSSEESINHSGDVRTLSDNRSTSTNSRIAYTVNAAQGLPFLNVRLRSDLTLTLEHQLRLNTTDRAVGDAQKVRITEDSSGSLSFSAQYSFSQKIRGGAEMLFESSENITNRVHKIREVKLWCDMSF